MHGLLLSYEILYRKSLRKMPRHHTIGNKGKGASSCTPFSSPRFLPLLLVVLDIVSAFILTLTSFGPLYQHPHF